ncbi:WYL domain-containing protein [Marinobacterium marinum]|uniref:WYL domain-containing protein n=1 Tax=Marinobacterium marinum TaxID=2756129 RepID=A0A7W2ACX5_9GAMM|nr:WYL domain-containing protein [Marinobacterium marinum]MBA4502992.1 WYL domain-containing protein [Marinobacterium marinum]
MGQRAFAEIPQPQQERLAHVEFRLLFLGCVNRVDLINRFRLSESAASRAFALYRQLAPGNIVYDHADETYRPAADFTPLYNYTPAQVLTALSEGYGDDFVSTPPSWLPSELSGRLSAPSLDVLIPVSRALFSGKALRIAYRSLSSGFSHKSIVPLVLVDNGLRWHLRAFDADRGRYADFVINRIESATVDDTDTNLPSLRDQDRNWHTEISLELVPHPTLAHPETIAFEYGMTDAMMTLPVRAALAGYLLRRWNVDCTTDHSQHGPEYHLWLRNSDILCRMTDYPIPNMTLAPGFVPLPPAATPSVHPRGTV